jgi:predicted nuclease of predicted toxin-antitoxin system
VKFLVDAQLPRRMCRWLADGGHDALHTLDLPLGNRTPDEALIQQADLEGRVLVTKDDDFVQHRLVRNRPRLLWLIAAGNIDNRALEILVRGALPQIEDAFESDGFVELGRDRLIVRA